MATHPETSEAGDDPRILEVVKQYQAELERGPRPDRSSFLARHPDLAPALAPYLDGLDLLHRGVRDLTRSGVPGNRLDTGLVGGDRLGEFELLREIGRGGMGVVYEARQASLNRRVAVKVLPATLAADSTRLRRFTVEAQAAAAVAHPHIVPVYAVGEDRGVHYYAMLLVEGVALDTVASATSVSARTDPDPSPTPPVRSESGRLLNLAHGERREYHREVARLGSQVARALDHAHQSGVVHRDVKPANLLLDRDGHVWVTDFGLAQFADGPAVTQTGSAIGTLRYMSPEQAAGDRRRLDHRTDIYSLGVTLYELLTGRPAFPAQEPPTLLQQLTNDDPPGPRSVDPTIPRDLETVLLKAMQKSPGDRYATAAEFADDLDRFLAGQPVLARRPWAWDSAKKWAARHPGAVAATLVSLLAVVLASGVATAMIKNEHDQTQKAYEAERERADEAERRFRQAKELGDAMLRISEEEIGSDSHMQGPRRQLLLTALESYRDLLAAGHDDPQVRAELDRVTARVQELLTEQAARREAEATFLLGFPEVRDELALSPEQAEKVRAALGTNGPGDRRSLDAATRQELLQLLSAQQRPRLRQIFFQSRGPMAFNDLDVIDALGLTATQRRQIKVIQTEAFGGFGPPGFGARGDRPDRPPGGPGKSPDRPPGKSLGGNPDAAKVTERIVASLTPEQRVAWQVLIGKPFTANR